MPGHERFSLYPIAFYDRSRDDNGIILSIHDRVDDLTFPAVVVRDMLALEHRVVTLQLYCSAFAVFTFHVRPTLDICIVLYQNAVFPQPCFLLYIKTHYA